MNNSEIIISVGRSMHNQVQKHGFAAPVNVLIDLGYLSDADLEKWRFGKIDYLERVCKVNLHKLSFIMKQVRAYAKKCGLKPSVTYYKRYGRKGKPPIKLRFSKYCDEDVERNYATHYVSLFQAAKKAADKQTERSDDNDERQSNEG